MLTPQEVSEHAFAKAGFGGYNMASAFYPLPPSLSRGFT